MLVFWPNLLGYLKQSLVVCSTAFLLLLPFFWFCSVCSHSVAGSLRIFYCAYSKRHLWDGEITINSCCGAQTLPSWVRTVEMNVPCLPSPALFLSWWHPAAMPHLYRDGAGLKESREKLFFVPQTTKTAQETNNISCEDHSNSCHLVSAAVLASLRLLSLLIIEAALVLVLCMAVFHS